MTSPLSRISAGNFFKGVICEYASLGWPGATVVGTNSILSIRPSSIAAIRTLRANGEAGENVSFIGLSLKVMLGGKFRHPEVLAPSRASKGDGWLRRILRDARQRRAPQDDEASQAAV